MVDLNLIIANLEKEICNEHFKKADFLIANEQIQVFPCCKDFGDKLAIKMKEEYDNQIQATFNNLLGGDRTIKF
jgi:hypothetical protein